jgi:hypothetical protein
MSWKFFQFPAFGQYGDAQIAVRPCGVKANTPADL